MRNRQVIRERIVELQLELGGQAECNGERYSVTRRGMLNYSSLKARSTIAVEIPDEAWAEGKFSRRIVPLTFKWGSPTPPDPAGATLPAPAGFHEFRLEY